VGRVQRSNIDFYIGFHERIIPRSHALEIGL
jgi:hypothetical protein